MSNVIKRRCLSCAICLQTITTKSEQCELECAHVFHASCIETWTLRKPTCPICRHKVQVPSVLVSVRGINIQITWESRLSTIRSLADHALRTFEESYQVFRFRYPVYIDNARVTLKGRESCLVDRPIALSRKLAARGGRVYILPPSSRDEGGEDGDTTVDPATSGCLCNGAERELRGRQFLVRNSTGSVLSSSSDDGGHSSGATPSETARAEPEVAVQLYIEMVLHPRSISHDDFQWGLLALDKIEKPVWSDPPCTDSYYRRSPHWVEEASLWHQLGRCNWSRRRCVAELEAELAHDATNADLASNDAIWAERRNMHVLLYQSLRAYADRDGDKPHLDSSLDEDPLDGPVSTTPVLLPSGRDSEVDDIKAEAALAKPVCLYGCPFALEVRGFHEYVWQLFIECKVIAPFPVEAGRGNITHDDKQEQLNALTAHITIDDQDDRALSIEAFRDMLMCPQSLDELPLVSQDAVLTAIAFPQDGLLYVINDRAPAALGMLPTLEPFERVIFLPNVSVGTKGMEMQRGQDDHPPSLPATSRSTTPGHCPFI